MKKVLYVVVVFGISSFTVNALDDIKRQLDCVDSILERSQSLRSTNEALGLLREIKTIRSAPFTTAECLSNVVRPAEINCEIFLAKQSELAKRQEQEAAQRRASQVAQSVRNQVKTSQPAFYQPVRVTVPAPMPPVATPVTNTQPPAPVVSKPKEVTQTEQHQTTQEYKQVLTEIEQMKESVKQVEESVKEEAKKRKDLSNTVKDFYTGSRKLFASILGKSTASSDTNIPKHQQSRSDIALSDALVKFGAPAKRHHHDEPLQIEPAKKKHKHSLETALTLFAGNSVQPAQSLRITDITAEDQLSKALTLYKDTGPTIVGPDNI